MKALADDHADWSFDGVDPSPDMLRLARQVCGPHGDRIRLHEGYIHDAPTGPFDAATAILTFHFISPDDRIDTIRQIRSRLTVGAPLIVVHLSFPQSEPERSIWIARHVAFGVSNGTDPEQAESARKAIGSGLTILSPEEDVAMLTNGGFQNVSLFYAGLSIKGWLAYAA